MKIDERKLYVQLAKKSWDISDLADAMGVCYQTVASIRKRGNPRPSTIGRMAKALGCEPEELLEVR